MSDFKEGQSNYYLKANERVLNITRPQIKEIFRWSAKIKETDPYTREQGEDIVELLKRNLSPVGNKPVPVVITIDEIKTLLWWQELSQVQTELTAQVIELLKNTRDKVKKETSPKT